MRRPTILLIENETPLSHAISLLLTQAAYVVKTVPDCAAALDDIRSRITAGSPFDLVITDFPFAEGDESAQACLDLFKTCADYPLLVITEDDSQATRTMLKTLGLSAWIAKPLDPDHFLVQVQALCATSNSRCNPKGGRPFFGPSTNP